MSRLIKGKMIRKRSRRMFQKNVLVLFCFMLLFSPFSTAFGDVIGDNTAEEATEITNLAELNEIRNDLDGNYRLGADIDLSDVTDWEPIGNEDNPFTGMFNGSGFKITGMDSEFEGADYSGLFETVSEEANITNVQVTIGVGGIKDEIEDNEAESELEEIEGDAENDKDPASQLDDDSHDNEENIEISTFSVVTADIVEFEAGTGTLNDPYQIKTAEQLNEVRNHLAKHFKLIADINLNVAPFNEGEGWEPIGRNNNEKFTGTFDGNDKIITGLSINRPSRQSVGLFGYVASNTSISTTKIINVHLKNVNVIGSNWTGGLAGYFQNGEIINSSVSGTVEGNERVGSLIGNAISAEIKDSTVSGTVTGTNHTGGLVGHMYGVADKTLRNSHANVEVTGSRDVGGLIGKSYHGNVFHSSSSGNVSGGENVGGMIGASEGSNYKIAQSYATGNVSGTSVNIGGLIGLNDSVKIEETYAHGRVEGINNVGGLIGRNSGSISDSYAVGHVISEGSSVGGLIGWGGILANSFYDQNTTGQSDTGKGEPRLTADMQKQTTFTDWDFTNVWIIGGPDEYPRFLKEGEEGVTSDVIYVKENSNGDGTSWDNAFGTLQEALDQSVAGKDIWIAEGTYVPTGNIGYANEIYNNPRTAHFKMKNRVGIYGGFPGSGDPTMDERNPKQYETILSGDLAGDDIPGNFDKNRDDNVYTVIINETQLDAGTILDGVTISGGHSMHHLNWDGGGIRIYGPQTKLTLRNLIIKDNYAGQDGGGISTKHADITLENAVITGNKAEGLTNRGYGGGLFIGNGSLTAKNVTINENEAKSGGGVSNDGANVTLSNADISGNKANSNGGGIIATYGSDSTFINTLISGNTVKSGGAGYHTIAGVYDNSVGVVRNKSTFINSTVSNNWTTENKGGAMYVTGSNDMTIKNSIIWGNYHLVGTVFMGDERYERYSFSGYLPRNIIAYDSIIEGISKKDEDPEWETMDQGGNLDIDPKFVEMGPAEMPTLAGDYRLSNHSMAINKGNNSHISGYEKDLSGKPRIVDGKVDMGAYEHQDPGAKSETLQLDGVAVPVEAGTTVTIGGTNASIELPGDLPKGTTLKVESVTPIAPGLTQKGEVFNFFFTFPAGKGFDDITGQFILTLGVDPGAEDDVVGIYHYNETTEAWELVGGDALDGKITIAVDHFSQYGVFSDDDIIYVKENGAGNKNGTSWDHAFATLQEGLDEATDGKQIWIAKGTYYPTKAVDASDDRTKTFQMKNGVSIYGGFEGNEDSDTDLSSRDFVANETILSGDLGTQVDKSDNAYHVFYHPDGMNLDETAVLDGVTITDGNADNYGGPHDESRGGGMYNDKNSPTLNNVNITDNFASNGGGMYNLDSNPTLTNVDIIKNRAGHGAGIMNVTSNPTLNDVTINQNEASGDNGGGGGMMNLDDSHPTLTNVEITDNKANGQYSAGGGINNKNSNLTLTNVTIVKNDATETGGGIYNSDGNTDLKNVSIQENNSKNGAGIYNEGTVMMDGGDITENIATSGGGGITSENPTSKMTLKNVSVTANKANQGAGMRLQNGTEVSIIGGDINSNEAIAPSGFASNGGAIYMYRTDTDVTISGTEIKNNVANSSGGGIYNQTGSLFLEDVIIEGNTSGTSGGGLYSSGGKQKIIGGEISNNTAASYGGGIANARLNLAGTVYLSTTELENVHIHGNSARSDGGGIYTGMDSTTILTNVTISNNEATENGGGVYNANSDDFEMTGGEITENTTYYGGGMYNDNSSPTLTNVVIRKNIASDNGGGMANLNDSSPILTNVQISENMGDDGGGIANEFNSNPTLTNTLISGNKSLDSGSGMFNNESSPTLINVTISNNIGDQDSEGMYNFGANPIIQNSIIWGHDESIVNEDGSTPEITHSLIEGSGGSGANWDNDFGTDGEGNLDADPKFVDGAYGDYRLLAGSPAINAGNDAFVPAGITTDLDGNARFIDAVDLGAYEFPPVPGEDVTAIYVDEADQEIASAETHSGNVGEAYTTVEKQIDGYTFKEVIGDAAGTFTTDPQEVKYVYTKDKAAVPDKKIIGSLSLGTMFDVGEKELADIISNLPKKVNVILDDGTQEELNVSKWDADSDPSYKKDTSGIYIFSGDIELTDGIVNSAGIRAKFSVSLNDNDGPDPGDTDKEITGFKWSGTTLDVGTRDRDHLPLPDKVQVTLDDNSKVDLVVDWEADSETPYNMNTVGTYIFNGDFKLIDGVINSKGFKAKFNIILKDDNVPIPESSVVVTHVDEDGEELAPSKILTGAEGEVYSTEVEEIEGYTFIKVNGNKSGIFTKNSIFVEYIYGLDLVDPNKDKEIINVPTIGTTVGLGAEDLADIISRFPTTVEVTLNDGTVVEIGVKWNEVSNPVYDKNKIGAYIFSGEFILPEGIANTANHIMIYQVNVFDYDTLVPTDPKEPKNPVVEPSEPIEESGDDSDKKNDKVDIIVTADDDLTKLPRTATPYYTIIFFGLLLIAVGGAVYFIIRRKRVI